MGKFSCLLCYNRGFSYGVVVITSPCTQKTGLRILAGKPYFHIVCYILPLIKRPLAMDIMSILNRQSILT